MRREEEEVEELTKVGMARRGEGSLIKRRGKISRPFKVLPSAGTGGSADDQLPIGISVATDRSIPPLILDDITQQAAATWTLV